MTLDEIYEKLKREELEKEKVRKEEEQLIIDNYNSFRKFIDNERRIYNVGGKIKKMGIGVMIIEKTNRVG